MLEPMLAATQDRLAKRGLAELLRRVKLPVSLLELSVDVCQTHLEFSQLSATLLKAGQTKSVQADCMLTNILLYVLQSNQDIHPMGRASSRAGRRFHWTHWLCA